MERSAARATIVDQKLPIGRILGEQQRESPRTDQSWWRIQSRWVARYGHARPYSSRDGRCRLHDSSFSSRVRPSVCTLTLRVPKLQGLPPGTGQTDPPLSLREFCEVSRCRYVRLWIDARIGPSISLARNRWRRYARLNGGTPGSRIPPRSAGGRAGGRRCGASPVPCRSSRWRCGRCGSAARSRTGRCRSRRRRGCPAAGRPPSGSAAGRAAAGGWSRRGPGGPVRGPRRR